MGMMTQNLTVAVSVKGAPPGLAGEASGGGWTWCPGKGVSEYRGRRAEGPGHCAFLGHNQLGAWPGHPF